MSDADHVLSSHDHPTATPDALLAHTDGDAEPRGGPSTPQRHSETSPMRDASPAQREHLAVLSGIHRAATAIRMHLENSTLRASGLTWTGFVVLSIVWTAGEIETRHVAEEAGISKGTLTGVAKTLESMGLLERKKHASDGRLVVLRATPAGHELMSAQHPRFTDEATFLSSALESEEAHSLVQLLQTIDTHLAANGEQRRSDMWADSSPPPRRSGRRAKRA